MDGIKEQKRPDLRVLDPEMDLAMKNDARWEGRPLVEALSEVNRELNVRRRCFPKWVKEGKLDQVEAQDRMDRLEAARYFLALSLKLHGLIEADTENSSLTATA